VPITVKLAGAIKRYEGRHQPETKQPHILGSTWAFTAAQPTSMCSWGPSTTVSLVVRNDGRGLLGSDGSRRHGMGVMGRRGRAVLLGGELDTTSDEGEGTTVTAVVRGLANSY